MNWRNIYKGMAMGIVETVPGVSSSTIAMLLGIYEKIIFSISNLTTKEYKKSLLFFIPIIIGILLGTLLSALLVKYFLETYPVPTHYLFIGLVLGMLPFIWRNGKWMNSKISTYKSYHLLFMVIFFLLIASLSFVVTPNETVIVNLAIKDYIYLFFAGWLASIALVLPGMSGALILMIVGAYYTALNALFTFDVAIIITIVAGIIIGILVTGKLVRFLLEEYHQLTYASIIGLLAGSVVLLFPGLPIHFTELFISMILLSIGFFFAYFVSINQKRTFM